MAIKDKLREKEREKEKKNCRMCLPIISERQKNFKFFLAKKEGLLRYA
jgi:hypothetical protein